MVALMVHLSPPRVLGIQHKASGCSCGGGAARGRANPQGAKSHSSSLGLSPPVPSFSNMP